MIGGVFTICQYFGSLAVLVKHAEQRKQGVGELSIRPRPSTPSVGAEAPSAAEHMQRNVTVVSHAQRKNGKRETSQEGHSIKSPCDNFTFLLFAPFGQGPSGSPSQRGMLANQTSITSNCFDYPVRRENTFGQIRRDFPMTQVGRLHCHAHRNINIARNTRRTFQSSKFQRM